MLNNFSINKDIYAAFKRTEEGKMIPLKKRAQSNRYYHMTDCSPVTDYLKDNEISIFITGSRIDRILEALNKQKETNKVFTRN